MPLNQFRVVLSAPDGRETAIGSDEARIEVADGVWIRVAFKMQDSAQLTVDLTLCGKASGREASGATGGRFVVIPLDEFSVLVAVAEASDSPVDLMPLASTPVWTTPDGGPMPTRQGILSAQASDGAGLILSFTPGPGGMAACVLTISSVPEDRLPTEAGRMRPVLSILRLAQETVRIAAGRAEENAI